MLAWRVERCRGSLGFRVSQFRVGFRVWGLGFGDIWGVGFRISTFFHLTAQPFGHLLR